MKNFRRIYTAIILLVCIFWFLFACTDTYLGRWAYWNFSDIRDHEKFPNYGFALSSEPFYFTLAVNDRIGQFPMPLDRNKNKYVPLDRLMEESGTTALIVIKRDTILYEKYFNEYDRTSINTSFSMAKSITSILIGAAIDEQLILSIDDPVTDYLPDFLQVDPQYVKVSIRHLLDMRSGIQFRDHDLPWGDKPKAYYHPRLRERMMQLPIVREPGTQFQYNSYNPIILGMVLEAVTGVSPAEYFQKVIWDPLQMEFGGSWSLDGETSGMAKMESGINARAVDFAKIGRMMLNSGQWEGVQIIPKDWVDQCMRINSKHHVPEIGQQIYYQHAWWLFSADHENAEICSAWGHLGQYLYIFAEEELIILRFGKKTGKVKSWSEVFKAIRGNLHERVDENAP
ncbi:MAG: serine hydrolase [Cyclobacteriaceae bacterium]|nr:serine hydrolase [Cyclobacteriaceae bacterium]